MPLYDYICDACGSEKKDYFKRMAEPTPACCSAAMRQIFQTKIEVFDTTMIFEHIEHEPKQFSSRRALRNYCRSVGVTSHLGE